MKTKTESVVPDESGEARGEWKVVNPSCYHGARVGFTLTGPHLDHRDIVVRMVGTFDEAVKVQEEMIRALNSKEVQEWREAIVSLIESLGQPERAKVCAKLATIPSVWAGLSEQDRQQAKMVLACAPEGGDATKIDRESQLVAQRNTVVDAFREASRIVGDLIIAANEAADWLCDAKDGSDPKERGDKLRASINRVVGLEGGR